MVNPQTSNTSAAVRATDPTTGATRFHKEELPQGNQPDADPTPSPAPLAPDLAPPCRGSVTDLSALSDADLDAYREGAAEREKTAQAAAKAARADWTLAQFEIVRRNTDHAEGEVFTYRLEGRTIHAQCVFIGVKPTPFGGYPERVYLPILKSGRLGIKHVNVFYDITPTSLRWTGPLTPGATGEVVEVSK